MKKTFANITSFFNVVYFCIMLSIKSSKKYFIILVLLDMIVVISPFIILRLSAALIDLLVENIGNVSELGTVLQSFLLLSIFIFALSILNGSIVTIRTYFEGLQSETMNAKTTHLIMEKAAKLDLSYFDFNAFYNDIEDASMNSSLVTQSAFQTLGLIRAFIQFFISFILLFQFSFILPFILVISIIPGTIAQYKQLEAIYSFQRTHMSEERKMQYASNVLLSQEFAKDVRIYNLFSFISDKFLSTWKLLFSNKQRITLRYTRLLLALSTFPEIVSAVIVFLLGLAVIQGTSTMGDFTYFQGIMAQVLGGLQMVIMSYTQLMDGKARIQNYLKFLNFESRIRDDGIHTLIEPAFTIEFRNVSFRYDASLPWVLSNVSFTMHSSQKIALVGANGSGKSTIIKLLLRFYDPVKGQILMDGKDIREYTVESVRRRFSAVFQEYCNYAFTVKESVSLSDINNANSIEDLKMALEQSGADSFVKRFPDEENTYLTRRYDDSGQELSGGQWQKIAIARAFFRKADIYILDEPSASLDAQSEDEMFGMFEKLYAGKGAFLISHRLSNVHLCSSILVMEDGALIEAGIHKELMEAEGVYAHMYRLQAQKYDYVEAVD